MVALDILGIIYMNWMQGWHISAILSRIWNSTFNKLSDCHRFKNKIISSNFDLNDIFFYEIEWNSSFHWFSLLLIMFLSVLKSFDYCVQCSGPRVRIPTEHNWFSWFVQLYESQFNNDYILFDLQKFQFFSHKICPIYITNNNNRQI